jgi:hypothetical protein
MGRRRDDALATHLYVLYQSGMSLGEVGSATSRTRQSVYEMFRRRGWALRSPVFQTPVIFDGEAYTADPDGYYRKTSGDRKWLHHAVWEFHHGPIPPGHDIHHADENKANNDVGNLMCLTPTEHGRIHMPLHPIPVKHCLSCGQRLIRRIERSGRLEVPAALAKRMFCNARCHANARRGKAKNWAVAHG